MKTKIYSVDGNQGKEITLPKSFDAKVRGDIVAKVLEVKKSMQPYGPNPRAGLCHSARGLIIHRRHVWKSGYGRGRSRVPRKVMSQKGSQFNWVAAGIPFARGGNRAHQPQPVHFINTKSINKKEMKMAFDSALSATGKADLIEKRYSSLDKIENVPFVVDSKLISLKAKALKEAVKKVLGEKVFNVIEKKKSIRAGKGKLRGRKYKSNAGLLIVVGAKEKLSTGMFEVVPVNALGVTDLAKGGLGRIVIYTEKAINEIGEKK